MNSFMRKLDNIGIFPIIRETELEKAEAIAIAAINNGIDIIELDYSNKSSEHILRFLVEKYPEVSFGVSGIKNLDEAKKTISIGASYVTSVDFNADIIDYCIENHSIPIPIVYSMSEVEKVIKHGAEIMKILPVKALGEKNPIKDIIDTYNNARVIVYEESGINNICQNLKNEGVVSCGVDFSLQKCDSIDESIEKLSQEISNLILDCLDFRLCHVGINGGSDKEALNIANTFSAIFGLKTKEEVPSYFSGSIVEVMKFMGKGKNGHIAIGTPNIERAIYHISRKGVEFDESTFAVENNVILRAYLKEEIGGFAIHLIRES